LEVASRLIDDKAAAAPARTMAAVGAVGANYWLGRYRDAVAIADRIFAVAASARDTAPFGLPSIELIAICALAEQGNLDLAEERAERMRRLAEQDRDVFAGPRANYCLGRIALMRGRAATARQLFARCLAEHSPFDSFMERHLGAMLAQASATCGDIDAATTALKAAADKIAMKTYDPEDDLAEAAVLAASLCMDDAAERAAWAAGVAAAQSEWNLAVRGYHDAARYGAARQVVLAMRAAAVHVDGVLARCYLDHAAALAASDGRALDDVGRQFETHGAFQLAAETLSEAALAHAARGDVRAARASGAHASWLWAQCESAAPPWLTGSAVGVALTARERQVAALAAMGRSDAAIATHLRISIRTVQTHLGHVYDKLGSAGRAELAVRLADNEAAREPT
ncbi:MAG: helix-turn-helix transcriptional regulator, partial [Acidothermaceae bacterium]